MLQEHFFSCSGLSGSYEKLEIPPDDLPDWMDRWQEHQLDGFNVTIPYKIQMLASMKRISPEADFIGAVNTVLVKSDGLYGENTDSYGFIAPLSPEVKASLAGADVVVLGAGGACRAVAYALLKKGVKNITFWIRNPERAQATLQLVQSMNRYLRDGEAGLFLKTTLEPAELVTARMLVNTTPVGMSPNIEAMPLDANCISSLPENALVYDLIYNPLETRLLKASRERGLVTCDGLDMLIYQGARAFTHWTGAALTTEDLQAARPLLLNAMSFPVKH